MVSETDIVRSPEAYKSYDAYFSAIRNLMEKYNDVPMENVMSAYARASISSNPFMQNSRVKHISTMPGDYSKADIVEMVKAPDNSEKALRSVAHGLEWSAYPFRKLRTTYQAINTARYYHYPVKLQSSEAGSEAMTREGNLLDAFNRAFRPDERAHQAIGMAWLEGKVAYVPRYSVDKSHNKINYAFWQQLPSDWTKITGYNSESGYTVMFNMVYFLSTPGSDFRQFGDLFSPYVADFDSVLEPSGYGAGKYAYASSRNTIRGADGRGWRFNMERFAKIQENAAGSPMLYGQNGTWAYWVTLPADAVWVFELDDTTASATPISTGLFITFDQISQIEDVALAVMQNPLVSIGMGEMEMYSDRATESADPIKLSPAGRATYLAYWSQMLNAFNAGGIAFYPAPFKDMHLETLPEATGSSDMTTKEYGYAVLKSGLSGLVPINSDPRAGAVNISAKLEERFCIRVYQQMERMMESIYRRMNLKYTWRFTMFGGFVSDAEDLENARKGISMGMLGDTFRYLALRGHSFWEDLSMSRTIRESGILDLRIPPATAYTMSNGTVSSSDSGSSEDGGRTEKTVDEVTADGGEQTEGDIDEG